MPPKKQDAAKARDESKVPDESESTCIIPDQSEVVAGSTIDQLMDMMEKFLRKQHQREDRFEREAQRQEHKWQVLHHQFTQLQSEVHQDRQPLQDDDSASSDQSWYEHK
ncbi:hypothetical protein G5714_011911 [Onychostoma macrolepis]|uniref:Uncharacterized protein n=1 Tax=Onychostoma macrolepis TaxID=369639 RepID=A0A7J6CJP6_9TELE|nr:hypothetical protein G5714_011911 [Onychostoma macrolepis]